MNAFHESGPPYTTDTSKAHGVESNKETAEASSHAGLLQEHRSFSKIQEVDTLTVDSLADVSENPTIRCRCKACTRHTTQEEQKENLFPTIRHLCYLQQDGRLCTDPEEQAPPSQLIAAHTYRLLLQARKQAKVVYTRPHHPGETGRTSQATEKSQDVSIDSRSPLVEGKRRDRASCVRADPWDA